MTKWQHLVEGYYRHKYTVGELNALIQELFGELHDIQEIPAVVGMLDDGYLFLDQLGMSSRGIINAFAKFFSKLGLKMSRPPRGFVVPSNMEWVATNIAPHHIPIIHYAAGATQRRYRDMWWILR